MKKLLKKIINKIRNFPKHIKPQILNSLRILLLILIIGGLLITIISPIFLIF